MGRHEMLAGWIEGQGMAGTSSRLDKDTVAWLATEFPGVTPKPLVDHPWAGTWVFKQEDRSLYLKKIHGDGMRKVLAAMSIARNFPDSVPPVVAANPKLGVMVVAGHGGTELKSRTENMARVLPAYANIQVRATRKPFGSKIVPRLEIINLFDNLIEFLQPENETGSENTVGAAHYIGHQKSRDLHTLFSQIRPILFPHLEKSEKLPQTLNHCDLRPPNMAMKDDGSIAIFDWDDALWGPAGLSLHAQFSGCLRPHMALAADADSVKDTQIKRDRAHLDTYVAVFVKNGLIDEKTMRENLSASIVAGALNYVIGFRHHAPESRKLRDVIGRNILKRLYSVMDVVEQLALPRKSHTRLLADAYFRSHHEERLEKLQKRFRVPLLDTPHVNNNR